MPLGCAKDTLAKWGGGIPIFLVAQNQLELKVTGLIRCFDEFYFNHLYIKLMGVSSVTISKSLSVCVLNHPEIGLGGVKVKCCKP